MDYTTATWLFKIKKSIRYMQLYGILRTLIKIKGQYHMKSKRSFEGQRWTNPACKTPDVQRRNIAIIGCGNYGYSVIAYYLKKSNPKFLRSTYDIDLGRSRSLCKAFTGAFAVADWKEIVADPQIKLVYIASNHASHAEYAVACIEAGKHVHIEKPHVVSFEQLNRLVKAMQHNPKSKVFLGFNRPKSLLFKKLQAVLPKENDPLMINWFIVGHKIPDDHWYFNENEGGRVLGNLCHWSDLSLHLVTMANAFPCTIVPATPKYSKSEVVVSIIFADKSCASIMLSAKGYTFEGVREKLNLQKRDAFVSLTDFGALIVEVIDKKKIKKLWYRDHGHKANILHSLTGVSGDSVPGEDLLYVVATSMLFLKIRQAVDSGKTVSLFREDITDLLK